MYKKRNKRGSKRIKSDRIISKKKLDSVTRKFKLPSSLKGQTTKFGKRLGKSLKKYRDVKKEAKKVISNTKLKAYDNLYNKLDTKEGKNDIYKLAKLRERKTKDFNYIKCVKGEDERVLIKDEEIKERWKSYFEKLLNGNNLANLRIEECDNLGITNEHKFFHRFSILEIKNALSKMKNAKALGPDAIPIEVWKG